jgi:hypothetical protein
MELTAKEIIRNSLFPESKTEYPSWKNDKDGVRGIVVSNGITSTEDPFKEKGQV